jgi:DNA-binding CsgD family transcriptional regulator
MLAVHSRVLGSLPDPNRDIAEKLTISRKTAGSHIEHIYTKTGVRNRASASLFAMRHGLMIESLMIGCLPDEAQATVI